MFHDSRIRIRIPHYFIISQNSMTYENRNSNSRWRKISQCQHKRFFCGVTEILEALLEQGDYVLATNIVLEKDYDLEDLEQFINDHPVSSDDLKEFISKLKKEN